MLRPFVAYLRVYEPLEAFSDAPAPPDPRLLDAVEKAGLNRRDAGEREQRMWLRSQMAVPVRLLPAELVDGRAAPSCTTDVLVLDPADVPVDAPENQAGPGPLVCPLDLRPRSAAALANFLGDAHPALKSAVLSAGGVTAEAVRSRTSAALAELNGTVVHVLSATWTVPLPWFAMVDPDQRRLVLGSGRHDPRRELSWRVAINDALNRLDEAHDLVEETFGEDSGPAEVLEDTGRWLSHFHPGSAVELDYGGLVQLMADPILEADTSAEDVHAILEALRSGTVGELAGLFADLREFWSQLATREHLN